MVNVDLLKKLPRPMDWQVRDPYIEEEQIVVPVRYTVHNGDTPAMIKETDVSFDKADYSKVINGIKKQNVFVYINQLGQVRNLRDEKYYEFLDYVDKFAPPASRNSKRFKSIEDIFFDRKAKELFNSICLLDSVLRILSKPEGLQSKSIREILA